MKTFIGMPVVTTFYNCYNFRGVVKTEPTTVNYADNTSETTVSVLLENGENEKISTHLLSAFDETDQFYKMPLHDKAKMKRELDCLFEKLKSKTKYEVTFNTDHGIIKHVLEGSIIEIEEAANRLRDIYKCQGYGMIGL